MEPVSGILGDNPGPDFIILIILGVQIVKLPQIGKLVPILLKSDVLHGESIDLLPQFFIFFQKGSDLHQFLGAVG